jgi:hypothetical protein
MVAPPRPCGPIGCRKQGFDLFARQMADLLAGASLAGNRQDALDQARMTRRFKGGVLKERPNGALPQVPASGTHAAFVLQVGKERRDQRRVELLQRQRARGNLEALLGEPEEEPEGVAIGRDRMRARLPLLHESSGEEPLQQHSEIASRGRHDSFSQ